MTAEHTNALLERQSGGIRVELAWLPITDITGVQVTVGERQAWASCTREQALDAFHHPFLYLSPAQVAELFPRVVEEEEA